MLDYTGKSANKLKEKTLYLLDMDGTIYNENKFLTEHWNSLKRLKDGADNMCSLPIILQNP